MRRIRTLAALPAAALLLGAGAARAAHNDGPAARAAHAQAATVTALSVVPGDGRADVVIALTGPVRADDFTVANPDRIVVDLSGAQFTTLGRGYDRQPRGGIRNIRLSQFSPGVVRVVLDLDAPHAYTVTRDSSEIRISVTGAQPFAAWSSRNTTPAVAALAAVPDRPAIARSESTGVLAPPVADTQRAPAPTGVNPIDQLLAAAPPASRGPQQSQQRRISITWEEADIADVLASFAEISGRTIVRGKAVTGTVSAEIKDQPWDIAMKAILDAHGLAATERP
jgi:type IV pilus assembly protein PilQ